MPNWVCMQHNTKQMTLLMPNWVYKTKTGSSSYTRWDLKSYYTKAVAFWNSVCNNYTLHIKDEVLTVVNIDTEVF